MKKKPVEINNELTWLFIGIEKPEWWEEQARAPVKPSRKSPQAEMRTP